MLSYSFAEASFYFCLGVYAVICYWCLCLIEPFSYYLIGGVGRHYKVHKNVETRYSDIVGCDELKKEVSDTIAIFRQDNETRMYTILFKGKSGTGKTFVSKAIAGECGLSFVEILSSGLSSSIMPTVVNTVIKKYAPCIIFIDECHGMMSYNKDYMLSLLDSMTKCKDKVIFIFATNKAYEIDSAVTRHGRIDKIINFDTPNKDERALHLKNAFPFLSGDQCTEIANKLGKITQAQVNFLKREYEFLQKRHTLNDIKDSNVISDIYHLIEKLQMGYHTVTQSLSPNDKYRIAVHEIGHAFTAFILKSSHNPTKVTINTVGSYAGYNIINFDDTCIYTKQQLLAICAVYYAGYVAEKYFFDHDTSTMVVADIHMIENIMSMMSNSLMIKSKDYIVDNDEDKDKDNRNNKDIKNIKGHKTSKGSKANKDKNITAAMTIIDGEDNDMKKTDLCFIRSEHKELLSELETFLIENIFKPYELNIKSLVDILVSDSCLEGDKLNKLFEPYQDKINKLV
jgi:ATP-dependent Zn protease